MIIIVLLIIGNGGITINKEKLCENIVWVVFMISNMFLIYAQESG